MNPIENLWSYLQLKLSEREITGEKMLKNCILEEWHKIPKEFCDKLVSTMNKRWKMVIKNKGGPIKY